MTDRQKKLQYLKDNDLSIFIENEGKTIYESRDPMLKPLFVCLLQMRKDLKGATVVDKIVGRAAAMLSFLGEVREVITPLASETARQVLQAGGIELYAEKMIPYIVNRDNTGMCPMEKMANESESAEAFFEKLKEIT